MIGFERARRGAIRMSAVCSIVIVSTVQPATAASRTTPCNSLFDCDRGSPDVGSPVYGTLFGPDLSTPDPILIVPRTTSAERTLQQEKPRPVKRTGWSALFRNIGSDFKAFPSRKSTWVILGIGAGAAAIVHPWDEEVTEWAADQDGLKKALLPGKYLGLGPVQFAAAFSTYLVGRYAYHPMDGRTNKVSHLGFDLLRAQILTQALTYGIKYSVQRDRPNGDCCAFPSGHASVTFATASVLERHFGYRSAWPTFVIAGYVAAGRLTENRHFMSDLLFGAALGTAAGWTVVGRHGRDDFTMMPVPVRGGIALSGTWSPGGHNASHATE